MLERLISSLVYACVHVGPTSKSPLFWTTSGVERSASSFSNFNAVRNCTENDPIQSFSIHAGRKNVWTQPSIPHCVFTCEWFIFLDPISDNIANLCKRLYSLPTNPYSIPSTGGQITKYFISIRKSLFSSTVNLKETNLNSHIINVIPMNKI